MKKSVIVARVVNIALLAAFALLIATPVTWGAWHEYIGMVTFVLIAVHVACARKALMRRARRHRLSDILALALDAALVVCVLGLVVSCVVISEHALWWAPAVPGAAWARSVHLSCSYWAFFLAFAHAGVHWCVAVGKLAKNEAAVWVARVALAVLGGFGAWSFVAGDIWSYMTLVIQFAFIDDAAPLVWRLLQSAGMATLALGVAHYAAQAVRWVRCRKKGREFNIPTR